MKYLRCRCGQMESYSSMGSPPCRACPSCGTTLAEHPDEHKPPIPHNFEMKFDEDTGEPYWICSRCGETADSDPRDQDQVSERQASER